jgi:translation initiation factor IF-3
MKKKEKAAKKAAKEKNRPAKSMRFKVGIQDNDMEHKLKQVRRFLNKGHPVSFEIQFRQRIWLPEEPTPAERRRAETLEAEGRDLLAALAEALEGDGEPLQPLRAAKAAPQHLKATFQPAK